MDSTQSVEYPQRGEREPSEAPLRPLRPLRVGLALDSPLQPRWIEHALGLIVNGQAARITTVITCPPATGATAGAGRNRSHALYRFFTKADRRVFRRQPDPAERVDIAPMVGNAASLRIGHGTPLSPDVVSALDNADLDVILSFGSPTVARHLVGYAQHGAWFYPDLLTVDGTGRLAGFEATVAGRDVVTTSLNELTPEGTPGRALHTAVSAVNRYSPHYTDRRVTWMMATFPARVLETLARTGKLPGVSIREVGPGNRERTTAIPGNIRMMGIAARLGRRLAAHAVRAALYRSEWAIAYRIEPELSAATLTRANRPGTYTFIDNPPDRFWADPFPVRDGDTTWLFVEEFPRDANRAHLSVMELRPDGSAGPATTVLTCPYHLSYPHVFRWRDDWYLVPETLENRTVDLYRSTRFPFEWTHERTLLDDVAAVDATLFEKDGRWWMFTTIAPFGGSENNELHIFMADTPLGPWRPLPGNPLKSDVRGSRPAGRIFPLGDAWYRPAQDCSRRYGYAMTIHRITDLTANCFDEEVAGRIEPTWARGLLGTHTINHVTGLTLVDGDSWRPRFRSPFRRLYGNRMDSR